MSRKYKVRNPDGLYFVTSTIVGWVDLFIRQEYKDIIINSLKHCTENKGLKLHAYVIMTSHIHLIVSTNKGIKLSDVMRDIKTYTSKKLLEEIRYIGESRREWMLSKFRFEAERQVRGDKHRLWQDGFHPKELLYDEMMLQKLEYIHLNPVKDRVVDEPEEYIYSSARQYAGKGGELKIDLLV